MAMDFFKNCSTNVHVVEKLGQTQFYTYTWEGLDDLGIWKRIQSTLARLRGQDVLCTATDNDLVFVFGDAGAKLLVEDGGDGEMQATGEGSLEAHLKTPANGRSVRDLLLDAIESSIAFALAKDECTTHVGPWTWIHRSPDDEIEHSGESSLIRLHAKFAKTGALYLIPEITSTTLSPAQRPAAGTLVLLAPCNRPARVLSEEAPKVVSDDQWKDNLALTLRSQGVSAGEDTEWIPVQPIAGDDEISFLWPSNLCFTYSTQAKPDIMGDEMDWRPWFATTDDDDAFRNPLTMAEEWFQDVTERNRIAEADINGDSATAIAGDPAAASATGAHGHGSDGSNTISPLNQRLLDQQAAMAGIYPTPPDGLAHATQTSHINPATTPSVTQGDTSLSGNDTLLTSDDKANELNAMTGTDAFALGQEDLFGDVEEMEFQENDIGDADFNFFDDGPDDLPGMNTSEDAEMPEAPGQLDAIDANSTLDVGDETAISKIELPESVLEVLDPLPLSKEEHQEDSPLVPTEDVQMEQDDDVKEEPPGMNFEKSNAQPEKPLSPFGIKERLLPPPVPASIAQTDSKATDGRRNSAFSPILFRSNANWREKYAIDETKITRPSSKPTVPNISLPKTRKKSRTLSREIVTPQKINEESESEEDSFESSSSESEPDLPPKMPWDNRKRKRHGEQDPRHPLAGSLAEMRPIDAVDGDALNRISPAALLRLLQKCSIPDFASFDAQTPEGKNRAELLSNSKGDTMSVDSLPTLEDISDLRREDLIYVAQVISMQVVTALDPAKSSIDLLCAEFSESSTTLPFTSGKLLRKTLEATFADVDVCDVPKITTGREAAPPQRAVSNPGKTPQGQPPRPPQRSDSMINSPDYFSLQAPYVRIRRGTDNWEMLPTCLSFWETLGLGPANGPKDVRAFCVFPDNEDLQILVERFLADVGTAYEGCKLGSHTHLRNVSEKDDSFEDGMAPVELEEGSMQGALKAYANTCVDLGKALASFSHKETDRTIVVYMVNPFPGDQAVQHLCACFWQLFKTYRDNLPKAHRIHCSSDVVLQLLPISLIAAPDMLVVPDSKQIAILAREVYDRCPPSAAAQSMDNTSVLPILAAPSLELASAAPRKIGFSLAAEPPSDLLHEGSVLHLAYAVSNDGLWMTVVWIDNTSQYQASTSFCLRGKTFADVAEEIWDRTREIMAARKVTWRIFIVTHQSMNKSISQCWRTLTSKPRPQSLCVTLLTVQLDPIIQLSPPTPPPDRPLDAGFLTPATTPQAATFTSSPADTTSNLTLAPPTPDPDSDPDAHLIDLHDETWGVLLSPTLTQTPTSTPFLSTGALYRRNTSDSSSPFGGLGVTVLWTIQVKPGGAVDEGSPKQGDLTLREVLRMFRGLGLLSRARGLERGGPVPVHVLGAMRGVGGLEGMLRRG